MGEADLNKERLELALEAAGLDLWENDLITGNVTRKATKTFAELGFSEDEIVSGVQDIYGLFHPDDIDTVRRAVADHLTGVTPQYRCEFRLRSKSGEWIWFANYGRIMDGHSETPGKRLIGVTFNIHDRKCRETEIAQINQQLTEQNRLLQQLNATLERLAANDSLTGLSNRRTLMELGAKEAKRTERFGPPDVLAGGGHRPVQVRQRHVRPPGRGPCDLRRGPGVRGAQAQRSGHRCAVWGRGIRHRAGKHHHRRSKEAD